LSCLWLFGSLLKTEHMGKPWNNESAEKWWACGRHVRQKELEKRIMAPNVTILLPTYRTSCSGPPKQKDSHAGLHLLMQAG